jgi:hypothetical protein
MAKPQSVYRAQGASCYFTTISNALLQDERLSHEAKGLLCELLSRPANWEITVRGIMKTGLAGREKVYRMLKEAENCGYIRSEGQERDASGKMGRNRYVVADIGAEILAEQRVSPRAENPTTVEEPCTGLPHAAEPHTANPPQQKKESTKDRIEKTLPLRARAVSIELDGEGVRGDGFDLPWQAVELAADLATYPHDQARKLAEAMAIEWAANRPPASPLATLKRAMREEVAAQRATRPAQLAREPHFREEQRQTVEAVRAACQRAKQREVAA